MNKRIPYTDSKRQELIDKEIALGLYLISDERHFDGNYLTFTDKKPFNPVLAWKQAAGVDEKLNILARALGIIDGN